MKNEMQLKDLDTKVDTPHDRIFTNLIIFLKSDKKLNKYADEIIRIFKEYDITFFAPMFGVTFIREKKSDGRYYTYAFKMDEKTFMISEYNVKQMKHEIETLERRIKLMNDISKDMSGGK